MGESSIVNVVGGGSLHREFDLRKVWEDFPHSNLDYDPSSFAAAVIRYDSPKATIMLYSSGKYSLAGATSIEHAEGANHRFVNDIEQMLDEKISDQDFDVRYLVGTVDLETDLDLTEVIARLGFEQTEYEPEQFPGLFYRPPDEGWFCLLFGSGKAVFSGVVSEEELESAHNSVKDKLGIVN